MGNMTKRADIPEIDKSELNFMTRNYSSIESAMNYYKESNKKRLAPVHP